jgi:hypothetical protein
MRRETVSDAEAFSLFRFFSFPAHLDYFMSVSSSSSSVLSIIVVTSGSAIIKPSCPQGDLISSNGWSEIAEDS